MDRRGHGGETSGAHEPHASRLDATTARPRPDNVSSASLDETVAPPRQAHVSSVSLDETVAPPRQAHVSSAGLGATTVSGVEMDASLTGFAPGSLIGRYIVLRRLGAGAMGVVFEAIDPELDRKVAIKLLQPDASGGSAATESADARARLVREAQALARLNHPNVVGIFDVGTHEEHVWLAMELVVGRTLSRWLAERGPDWREVLEVMQAAGRGLAAAHSVGLVHRDIKPDNIMLGDDGRVRVMDFGLARRGATREGEPASANTTRGAMLFTEVTHAGAMIGTPAYMAPEQFRGETVGAQADVFAFCVMLWEGLHGERPFAGKTVDEVRANVAAGRMVARSRRTRSPRWIDAVLIRGLSTAVEQRWASMDAVLAQLERGQTLSRARRWVTAAGVLALAGVGVVVHGRYTEAEAEAACEAAGASIDEVWNEGAQARLRAGLLATDVSHAETTASKVMPYFAAQAEALRRARTEACLDTQVRGVWDEETRSRSEWCLDERRMELAALVAELSRADKGSVQRAVQAAAKLSQVSPCRDRHKLESQPAPPQDRETAQDVRRMLSRAVALRSAGKYEEELEVARAALIPAESLAWPPLAAAAHRQIGIALESSGRYPEAEAELEAAYFQAAAAFALEEAADAAVQLVFLVGGRHARHDEGLRWSRHADVALSLLGAEDEGLRRAAALKNLAIVRADAAAYEEARALTERALAIHERVLGPDHPAVANVLNDLGILRFIMQANDEARALHERALAIREKAIGPEHPEVALSLCNLANVRVAMGASDEAKALAERALAIDEKALGPEHPEVAGPLIILAGIHLAAGQIERAKALSERVLASDEKAFGPEHPKVALSLNVLASIHRSAAEYEEAKALMERALAIREKVLGPEHPEVAVSLYNLATILDDLGASKDAEALLIRGLTIQEKALGPDHPEVIGPLELLADVRLSMGAPEEARPVLERLLVLQEKLLGPDHTAVGKSLDNLASIALEQKRPADAALLADRALRVGLVSGDPEEVLMNLRFTLAQALWDAPADGPRDRPRARVLAEQVLEFRRATKGEPEDVAEVEAFLAKH